MELTRMPNSLSSIANVLVSATSACLLAASGRCPVSLSTSPTSDNHNRTPIAGIDHRGHGGLQGAPRTRSLTPITVSHCSSVSSQSLPQPSTLALTPRCREPAELLDTIGHQPPQPGVVAHIHSRASTLRPFGFTARTVSPRPGRGRRVSRRWILAQMSSATIGRPLRASRTACDRPWRAAPVNATWLEAARKRTKTRCA